MIHHDTPRPDRSSSDRNGSSGPHIYDYDRLTRAFVSFEQGCRAQGWGTGGYNALSLGTQDRYVVINLHAEFDRLLTEKSHVPWELARVMQPAVAVAKSGARADQSIVTVFHPVAGMQPHFLRELERWEREQGRPRDPNDRQLVEREPNAGRRADIAAHRPTCAGCHVDSVMEGFSRFYSDPTMLKNGFCIEHDDMDNQQHILPHAWAKVVETLRSYGIPIEAVEMGEPIVFGVQSQQRTHIYWPIKGPSLYFIEQWKKFQVEAGRAANVEDAQFFPNHSAIRAGINRFIEKRQSLGDFFCFSGAGIANLNKFRSDQPESFLDLMRGFHAALIEEGVPPFAMHFDTPLFHIDGQQLEIVVPTLGPSQSFMLDQKLTPRTISELVQATGLLYRELAGLEPDAVKPFFARHAEINDPERMASRQAIWVRSDSDRKDFGLLRDLYRTVYDAFQSANSRANRHAATLPLLPAMLDTRRAVLYDSGRSKMGLALPIFRYSPVMMRFLERVGMPGTCFFDPDHDTAAVRNLGQRSDNTIAGKTAYTERPSDLRWVVMESMYKLDEERRALDLPIEAFEVFAPMSYMSSQGTVVATPFGSLSQHILRQLTDMK